MVPVAYFDIIQAKALEAIVNCMHQPPSVGVFFFALLTQLQLKPKVLKSSSFESIPYHKFASFGGMKLKSKFNAT